MPDTKMFQNMNKDNNTNDNTEWFVTSTRKEKGIKYLRALQDNPDIRPAIGIAMRYLLRLQLNQNK